MSSISEKIRSDAKSQRDMANLLMKSTDLQVDLQKQIAATTGFVTANVLDAVADLVDVLRGIAPVDDMRDRRRALMERNDAIKSAATKAAVTGDWKDFDQLSGLANGSRTTN